MIVFRALVYQQASAEAATMVMIDKQYDRLVCYEQLDILFCTLFYKKLSRLVKGGSVKNAANRDELNLAQIEQLIRTLFSIPTDIFVKVNVKNDTFFG